MKLDDIKTVIFDMDGVITSEYMYWDAAALTVYELLFSRHYFGTQEIDVDWCMDNISHIRDVVFCGDKTVLTVKNSGVNTNWDLALIVFCVSKAVNPNLEALDTQHFKQVRSQVENLGAKAPELYDEAYSLAAGALGKNEAFFKREQSEFWTGLQASFGHWFLGTDKYVPLFGKPHLPYGREGLTEREKPMVPLEELDELLNMLKQKGIKLGIGTGRPITELYPLKMWDIEKYFDKDYCANYTDIVKAESENDCEGSLAKPHSFVFLKAAAGNRFTDAQIISGEYDDAIIKSTLIVGDAPSDHIAAKAAGFRFAAVLTGINGTGMREYFEKNGADIIIDSVLDLVI